MTMLGHPSQTFVLTNYILWCNRTRKKKMWSCGPHDHTKNHCGLEAYTVLYIMCG